MGVFDTVLVPCPRCGARTETQSKGSGDACLRRFLLEETPLDVMADVNRHAPFTCPKCGASFDVELNLTVRVRDLGRA